jgi:hypothetical protein
MRKLLLATAAMLALAVPASAAIIGNLGPNPTSSTGDFSSGVLGVNGTGLGPFDDQVLFSLTGGPQHITIASATNVFPGGNQTADFITNFSASVFEIVGVIGGGDDILVLGPAFANQGCGIITNCQVLAGAATLNNGNYYLDLSGTGGGSSGYGGNISTFAVPSPIVGAGLPGLIAFAMGAWGWRRRKVVG